MQTLRAGRSSRRMATCATALLAVIALAVATTAQATPPVLKSTSITDGFTSATWELPAKERAEFAEIATSTATNEYGYFVQKSFVAFKTLTDNQTSYTDDTKLLPGTYYVHIAGSEPGCQSCPRVEFSNIMEVVVNAAGSGVGRNIGPTPIGKPKQKDTRAPSARLAFKHLQNLDKILIKASMDEPGTLTAEGSVRLPGRGRVYRFGSLSRAVRTNVKASFRLRLASKARGAVKRALAGRQRPRARITITAIDLAGNHRKRTIVIRLLP
jgi:hypothetical protein